MKAERPAAFSASVRRTLLAWLMLPLLVLVPLAAALVYFLAVRPALDALDHALTDTAVALTGILAAEGGRPVLPLTPQTARALRADLVDDVSFAVGDEQGALLGGDAALLPLRPPLAAAQWVFFDATLRGQRTRVVAHGVACGEPVRVCAVLVAESLRKRAAAEAAVGVAALGAALLLATSIALLALVAVQRGLRPLHQASVEIEQRSLQRLEPIAAGSVPREAASFVVALNGLFARLRSAAAAQRAFIEDASHQLRTPLATMLSESAQALAGPHPPELRPRLERLHSAAERGAHLAQQLLTLARAEGATPEGTNVDLAALAAAGADEWLRPSLAAGQDLGFELAPAPLFGNALLLRELIGNLVDNARLHAGRGARVTVRTRCDSGQAVLEVEDDGVGLAAEEAEGLWDRFRRGSGAGGHGSGLGLAIVRDIARLHGGDAALEPGAGGRGVVVRVTLPQAVAKLS
jgi:two-component system, OmpR family, sensor histidine kinase TctE